MSSVWVVELQQLMKPGSPADVDVALLVPEKATYVVFPPAKQRCAERDLVQMLLLICYLVIKTIVPLVWEQLQSKAERLAANT